MTTRVVNGTSIQAAIDASASGDVLDVRAGGYAGFSIPAGKALTVAGTGAVNITGPGNTVSVRGAGSVLRGLDISGSTGVYNACVFQGAPDLLIDNCVLHDGACFGVRNYRTSGLHVQGGAMRKLAQGIEFNRSGQNSWVRGVAFTDMDRMVVNDPAPNNDTGGNAFAFYHSVGPIEITGCTITRARTISYAGAPASYDYGADGSAFEFYGAGTGGVLIENNDVIDCLLAGETGKGTGEADYDNVTIRGNRFTGRVTTQISDSRIACNGWLLRSAKNWTIEANEFRNIDWWIFDVQAGGKYGGALANMVIRNNKAWLKPGVNRWFSSGAGVNLAAFTMGGNTIYHSGAVVAQVDGKGQTSDRGVFQGWTGLEATSTWGPEPPPVPVETPLQKAIRERDEALANLASTQAALVAANSAIASTQAALMAANALVATRTAERDTALASANAASGKLVVAKTSAKRASDEIAAL